MKKFEILEHKADLKIKAFGKTKKEVFLNMLLGMINSLQPKIKNQKSKIKKIKIKSLDSETLLVDFLNELLYLIQVNKEIYQKVKFTKFTDNELEGEISGKKVEKFGKDIKAVTYHGLKIYQREDKIWEGVVLFDI